MIKSMTGYGSATGTSGLIELKVEIRSVNNRFFDCNIKIPRVYTACEDIIRNCIQGYVSRGKIDVFITVDSSKSEDSVITVNKPVADMYYSAINKLAKEYDLSNSITAVEMSKYPDVLIVTKQEDDMETFKKDLLSICEKALVDYNAMREKEGEKLYHDVKEHLENIGTLVKNAELISGDTVKNYREKLYTKIQEVLGDRSIDETRVLTEVAIFADRIAVDEEITRLKSHISQLGDMLEKREPIGRKMDFLIQEFNREANTMGSKGNDINMAKLVVEIKSEIEKIREQIQNIE